MAGSGKVDHDGGCVKRQRKQRPTGFAVYPPQCKPLLGYYRDVMHHQTERETRKNDDP